ncbi:MAG TPA: response regulator transcription factor [Hyphomicrobiaceae bacterium]|nr:response regulator transcription factor [Hyphomicrobiaceae bacterium]
MRVLIVEDEARIAEDLRIALDEAGYVSERAADGEAAWFKGDTEDFYAVILDLGLPKLDGMTVLRRWREGGRNMPVLVLTARDSWRDKVDGIDAGADDYLAKPFQIEEVIARIRALIRRSNGQASTLLTVDYVSLDLRQRDARIDNRKIALTALEFRCLSYLMHNSGRVVSQSELLEHVYGRDFPHESNALEVLISRLRRKLGLAFIRTKRSEGYVVGGN